MSNTTIRQRTQRIFRCRHIVADVLGQLSVKPAVHGLFILHRRDMLTHISKLSRFSWVAQVVKRLNLSKMRLYAFNLVRVHWTLHRPHHPLNTARQPVATLGLDHVDGRLTSGHGKVPTSAADGRRQTCDCPQRRAGADVETTAKRAQLGCGPAHWCRLQGAPGQTAAHVFAGRQHGLLVQAGQHADQGLDVAGSAKHAGNSAAQSGQRCIGGSAAILLGLGATAGGAVANKRTAHVRHLGQAALGVALGSWKHVFYFVFDVPHQWWTTRTEVGRRDNARRKVSRIKACGALNRAGVVGSPSVGVLQNLLLEDRIFGEVDALIELKALQVGHPFVQRNFVEGHIVVCTRVAISALQMWQNVGQVLLKILQATSAALISRSARGLLRVVQLMRKNAGRRLRCELLVGGQHHRVRSARV